MAADTRKQQLIAAWLAWLAHLAWLAWLARGLSNFFYTLDHVWKLLTCNALPVHLLRQVQKSMFFFGSVFPLFSSTLFIDFSSFFRGFWGFKSMQSAQRKDCYVVHVFSMFFW